MNTAYRHTQRIHSHIVWIEIPVYFDLNWFWLVFLFLALSNHDPEITGLSQSYAYGDYIDANCTSDQSNPPSELSWYIDERKVSTVIIFKA